MPFARAGIAGLALLFAACPSEKQSEVWPEANVASLLKGCPTWGGTPAICECLIGRVRYQVPWSHVVAWINRDGGSGSDLPLAMVAAMQPCTAGIGIGPWPPSLHDQLIAECRTNSSAESCGCLARLIEKTVPYSRFVASGLAIQAGLGADPELLAAFKTEEAAQCSAVRGK